MKQRLCQYGNCDLETTTVTVVYGNVSPAERPAFCGATHAALWLLGREGHRAIVKEIEQKLQLSTPSDTYLLCACGLETKLRCVEIGCPGKT